MSLLALLVCCVLNDNRGLLLAAFGLVGGASDVGAGAGRQVPLSALLARHRDILVHVGAFL